MAQNAASQVLTGRESPHYNYKNYETINVVQEIEKFVTVWPSYSKRINSTSKYDTLDIDLHSEVYAI